MKYIVRKAFWNFEKEEKWLNEMSAKGLALTDYSWCRYAFADAPVNEYTYRIELLNNPPAHAESAAYIRFLEESGIECVAFYMRWIYLRKKTIDGEFDIYSDIESKVKHYQRVYTFWFTMMMLEFFAGGFNITMGLIGLITGGIHGSLDYVNLFLGFFVFFIGLMFFGLTRPLKRKINMLKKEREIRE